MKVSPSAQYEKMAERLRTLKGSAIVRWIDHPENLHVFSVCHIETVPIQYTVGSGRGVERTEMIIFSWDDAARLAAGSKTDGLWGQ
ncbi:DNA methyltransferase [Burkholderia multivorans]|nr:DNA methyltransferase [Burkholderia multivorans]MBU9416217.1 DNA methyltransferase [Burkholderia multivorans]MBU9478241.1 DNA methyltransferase [Burkholderia multivorans]